MKEQSEDEQSPMQSATFSLLHSFGLRGSASSFDCQQGFGQSLPKGLF